MTSKISLISH